MPSPAHRGLPGADPADAVSTPVPRSCDDLAALFHVHPRQAAPALLGCLLTAVTADGAVTVRLTELEAYGDRGEDPGAHSYRGRTERNAALFGPPQRTYVYLNYGIHRCLNLVVHEPDAAGGLLVRAAEVVAGHDLAVLRRGRDTGARLLSGPGNLGQGLGITLEMGHLPITLADAPAPGGAPGLAVPRIPRPDDGLAPAVFVLAPPPAGSAPPHVSTGPRVGVSGEGGSARFPWRHWITGDASVSRFRAGRNVPA
ncbi:DNA-3-methyladenine glycosylase [Micrococcus lylae]|uniref:Putative 3-methyladenine DNA glycosylase n=1 Tax=Micrococcus lylae TaxID=1273 RepID=A0ABY2K4K0_9MICC|nr:DNA-3-methyladenine glycosylase [Micrococcus lylae]TFH99981.1 DNA-3-methyladenine glycosylase [Micrococcus lylae]